MTQSILIVEDEQVLRSELRRLLVHHGYRVTEAGSVKEALDHPALGDLDLILTDLRLPGAAGTELIGHAPGVPVLVMTSYATVKSAVDAMRQGAVDYIAKPLDHDELLLLVEQIVAAGRPRREKAGREAAAEPALRDIVGRSSAMQDVFERIRRVAPTDSTVLILGESGTGKALVARAIHALSGRRDAPLVTMSCAVIPTAQIEAELFGDGRGTGQPGLVEAAHGGTLFLDEVAELPLPVQGQLLRVLHGGEVRRVGSTQVRRSNVRLVAASHRDLARMVEDKTLRADLYFRLRVVDIALPPLRARGDDIEEIALALLEKIELRLGRPRRHTLSPEALLAIRAHPWPGNVRELENALERAVILSDAETVIPEHLGLGRPPARRAGTVPTTGDSHEDLSLAAYFKRFVLTHQAHMNESELAAKLGISRKTLWERRLRYALPRPRAH